VRPKSLKMLTFHGEKRPATHLRSTCAVAVVHRDANYRKLLGRFSPLARYRYVDVGLIGTRLIRGLVGIFFEAGKCVYSLTIQTRLTGLVCFMFSQTPVDRLGKVFDQIISPLIARV